MCAWFKITTVILTACLIIPVSSLALVNGTVKDTTGAPVVNAIVTFTEMSNPDNSSSTRTDINGAYFIDLNFPFDTTNNTPAVFSLGQNYPNPFNPSTTIPFTLESASHVELTVINIMGQRVATILNSYMNAGTHQVPWNGLDDKGSHVGTGVYLYRLQAGRHVETKKMLLLDGGKISSTKQTTLNSPKTAVATYFKVTISNCGIIRFEETIVAVNNGLTLNFTVILNDGYSIVNHIAFVTIPSGTFNMGSHWGEILYDFPEERPVHSVVLSSFEMSVCEITQGQYKSITGTNPSYFTGDDSRPVEQVSWFDAVKFCNKLSDAAGLERCYNESTWECDFTKDGFRLPTEAEWEYACRAGTETEYYWGDSDEESDVKPYCWYMMNAGIIGTQPVGTKQPNKFGLYDIIGNVEEWCNDLFYYSYNDYDDPSVSLSPVSDPSGSSLGSERVTRGGSWNLSWLYCRSAKRDYSDPSKNSWERGFRVVRRSPGNQTGKCSLTINVNLGDWGTAAPSVRTLSYYEEMVVTITAIPASGYRFAGWTGPVNDALKETTWIKMSGDMTVTVNFEKISFETCEFTMVSIPGGSFQMGDVWVVRPVHTVTLTGFEMSIYEITQEQYQAVMGTNPAKYYGVGNNYPVHNVSWYDAVKFCNRLSDLFGFEQCYNDSTWECDFSKSGFRLPTEAEWEYACRAGTETYFYTGGDLSSDSRKSMDLEKAGWYRYNWGDAKRKAHTVGDKKPNAWGLYDMHGNVFEWCNDWYGESYYASSPTADPVGPTSGSKRVDRGGSWEDGAWSCVSAFRYSRDPSYANYSIGFRVVRRP